MSRKIIILIIILSLNIIRYFFEYLDDTSNIYYGIMLLLNIMAICFVIFSKNKDIA